MILYLTSSGLDDATYSEEAILLTDMTCQKQPALRTVESNAHPRPSLSAHAVILALLWGRDGHTPTHQAFFSPLPQMQAPIWLDKRGDARRMHIRIYVACNMWCTDTGSRWQQSLRRSLHLADQGELRCIRANTGPLTPLAIR